MDPFSIVATSFSLASCIAKTSMVITVFCRDVRDASDDLDAVAKELRVLGSLLDPLSTSLTQLGTNNRAHDVLLTQIGDALSGCLAAVDQIESTIRKYNRDKTWTKMKWAIFGQEDMEQLRRSLASYKIALGIGLHALSISTVGAIKNDTQAIRDDSQATREIAELLNLKVDDLRAKFDTISHERPNEAQAKVERWLEKMSDFTTYAETAYQASIVDLSEQPTYSRVSIEAVTNPLEKVEEEEEEEEPVVPEAINPRPTTWTLPQRIYQWASLSWTANSQALRPSSETDVEATVSTPVMFQVEDDNEDVNLDYMGLNWSHLVPHVLTKAEFRNMKTRVKKDERKIQEAERRRLKLAPTRATRLDAVLYKKLCSPPPEDQHTQRSTIRSLLGQGAKPQGVGLSPALHQAVVNRDHVAVFSLLNYGADLETFPPGSCRPLVFAAGTDATIFCALVMAGAKLSGSQDCPNESSHGGGSGCCSPLLSALVKTMEQPSGPQCRVAQFLIANKADHYLNSCQRWRSDMIRWQARPDLYDLLAELLAQEGSAQSYWARRQLMKAIEALHLELVRLLVSKGTPLEEWTGSPSENPIIRVVLHGFWDCLSLLARPRYVHPTYLVALVKEFMYETNSMTLAQFERAVEILGPAVDVNAWRLFVTYHPHRSRLSNWRTQRPIVEKVTPVELAERIENRSKRDRDWVISVLRLNCKKDSRRVGFEPIS
ncbi:hypothetical protein B0T10DRAFT_502328 [Thelonectria olida]|uniref:Azaphilone pigments biosynthesis cluster protein L N-terminal domain-containing protein n=1 Tax=Thelonectria olida TaxID=1576542 RepID=A0A9P9ADW8_9HYPO|nr:hypothetical protein B0T10DRAFT_502328 [Thelonectria olida]